MKKMGIILAISFSLCLIFFGVFMIVKEQDRLNKEIKKKEIELKQEKETKKEEEKVENQTEKETKTEEPTQNTTQDEKTDIENAIDNYQHHINLEYFINSDMETTIKKEFSENNHNYTVESTADVVRIMVDNILIYERKHNETINSLENFTIYYMDIINDLIVFTSHIGTNITGFSITGLTLTGKEVFHYSNNIDPNIDSVRINSQKYSIDKNTNTIYVGGGRGLHGDIVIGDDSISICNPKLKEDEMINGNYKIDINDINNVKMEFVESTYTIKEYRKDNGGCKSAVE